MSNTVTPDFNGTGLAATHIGQKKAKNLSRALSLTTEPVLFSLSIGAEAADVIRLSLQAKDRGGNLLSEVVRAHVRLYDAAMIESLAAAFTLSEVANSGTVQTTDAQASVLVDTELTGLAELDVTDVVGASGATIHCLVEPVDREGPTQQIDITFD